MRVLGSVLQLVGLGGVSAGGWLLTPWLGVVLGGASLFAVGLQLEILADAPSET